MIEFQDVHRAFGEKRVLNGLSFVASDGRVTGFVGPNGSGKSTSLKVLAGLLSADSGRALIDGEAYGEMAWPGRKVGFFLGPDHLPGSMTGAAYLTYVADLCRTPRSRVATYLEVVGLGQVGKKKVSAYSLGMRQRLGIAGSLITEARNLVLDEPVNGLDIEGVLWMRDYLRAAADSGRCVVLSSHLLSELQMVADDIVILGGGVARRQGPLAEMLRDDDHGVTVRSEHPRELIQALSTLGVQAGLEEDGGVRVTGQTVNQVATFVGVLGVPITGVFQSTRAIEDVYLAETADQPVGGHSELVGERS